MSIVAAFVDYFEEVTSSTLGQDLFVNRVPSSPDETWWLRSSGGNPLSKLATGEMTKAYRIDVFYRGRSPQNVDAKLFELEEELNSSRGVELTGFSVIDVQATSFPTDNDLDDEDRYVGLLQVTISTYKE